MKFKFRRLDRESLENDGDKLAEFLTYEHYAGATFDPKEFRDAQDLLMAFGIEDEVKGKFEIVRVDEFFAVRPIENNKDFSVYIINSLFGKVIAKIGFDSEVTKQHANEADYVNHRIDNEGMGEIFSQWYVRMGKGSLRPASLRLFEDDRMKKIRISILNIRCETIFTEVYCKGDYALVDEYKIMKSWETPDSDHINDLIKDLVKDSMCEVFKDKPDLVAKLQSLIESLDN